MSTRREMLVMLGAGALAVPLSPFAQQRGKIWRVGFLYFASRQSALDTRRHGAFLDGMRELGYVSGTNLVLEERYADGKIDRLPGLAAELVRLKVDVIVATGGPVYRALQQETHTIPIVTTVMPDPVGDGYAKSMARPGGNFTGFTVSATDLGPKLLELVGATVPKMTRIGVMMHPNNVTHPPQLVMIMSAAQKAGMHVILAQAGTVQEIERELAMLARERIGAVIIINDNFFVEQLRHIATQALKNKLPSISQIYGYAEAGGLMSYGPDQVDNYRRAATYVDKILKGAKAGDLPFEQPTRYYLEINRKTANALGIKIPQSVLVRADKVIE
jgi:putative ABC transport system substrate-binding protein